MIKAKREYDSLTGVSCGVTNCVYNSADRECHADHIQVANQISNCKSEEDTFCHTFEAK